MSICAFGRVSILDKQVLPGVLLAGIRHVTLFFLKKISFKIKRRSLAVLHTAVHAKVAILEI